MVKLIPDQKLLLLDIEWRPTTAYVWKAWDVNIGADMIKEHGGLLCVGAKWLGEKKTHLFSEWEHTHEGMLQLIHDMISVADAVITYNGDRFDNPKLQGEFLLYGLQPTPPVTSIDCLKAVKKFGFFQNGLKFIGPFLKLGSKLEHEGMGLWIKVMDGDKDAQDRMAKYCIQDVDLLEELYLKIRPFIRNHPHMGKVKKDNCPACGSLEVQSRGTRRTRAFKIQRLQCQGCGGWFDGLRTKI